MLNGWAAHAEYPCMSARARVLACLRSLLKSGSAGLPAGEELFQSVFAEAATGMVIASLDGRVVHANRAFCELTGYDAVELRGRRFSEFTHPDDIDADAGDIRRLIAGQ